MKIFQGRSLVIATQHGKEEVICPVLVPTLGVDCYVPDFVNTDDLGTFTGEIERPGSPLDVVRQKCQMAREVTGMDLVVANEGTFAPHPYLHFVPSDEELIMLTDYKNNIEIYTSLLSTETNYAFGYIHSHKELSDFAERVLFPSHTLLLKDSEKNFTHVVKDIKDWDSLSLHFEFMLQKYGTCYVETDMRAHHNPTRMKVIQQVCLKLIEKVGCLCPQCATPGFGVVDVREGLPCSFCGFPTRSILSHVYKCMKCLYTQEKRYPFDKTEENPMYCDFCNP